MIKVVRFVSFYVLLPILACVLVFLGVDHYSRRQARKERRFAVSYSEQWNSFAPNTKKEVLPNEIKAYLEQPFFFIGQGRQTLVFASADRACVLKLFKHVTKRKKWKNVRQSFLGASLASTKLQKETGMLFCSIGGLEGESLFVTLLGKKGKIEKVDLSITPFILQKKAQSLKEVLLTLRALGHLNQAKECIHSLFFLLASLRENHIVDRDGALIRNGNIGLIGHQAVLIDTGKLCVLNDSKKQTLHDLNRLRPFFSWCKEAYPELLPELKNCCKEYKALLDKGL